MIYGNRNEFGGGFRIGSPQMQSPERILQEGIGGLNREGARPVEGGLGQVMGFGGGFNSPDSSELRRQMVNRVMGRLTGQGDQYGASPWEQQLQSLRILAPQLPAWMQQQQAQNPSMMGQPPQLFDFNKMAYSTGLPQGGFGPAALQRMYDSWGEVNSVKAKQDSVDDKLKGLTIKGGKGGGRRKRYYDSDGNEVKLTKEEKQRMNELALASR